MEISPGARDSLEVPLGLVDVVFVGGDMIPIFNVMLHREFFRLRHILMLEFEGQPLVNAS